MHILEQTYILTINSLLIAIRAILLINFTALKEKENDFDIILEKIQSLTRSSNVANRHALGSNEGFSTPPNFSCTILTYK